MKIPPLFFLLFISHFASAQQVNQCGIIIPPSSSRSNFTSVNQAGQYIRTMLESISWQENFTLQEKNGINNAYATVINGRRFIVYDNNFLENLDVYAGTKWASLSVLAHEMGHHYRNHVIDPRGSTPPKELEADYFSGYVMAKIGATLPEAASALSKIASQRASATHPARPDRIKAIASGWNYAKGHNNSGNRSPVPAPQPQENPPPPASNAGWINLYLYGNNQMTVYLSDNGRTYSPVPLKTTQPFVFKYDIYTYGFLRFTNSERASTYKLINGKDYSIVWNRRTNNWTVVHVP
ncbi:MAG TPA: M48 family metalloprotease [Sphingobacteriaceae bacterium]|nr:M48 family metalloprotease [Sphingobacteriaceae bacterium]